MMLVEEIEQAIESLPPQDLERIAHWFRERDDSTWNLQLDRDSASGKLDFLFSEAESESAQDLLRPWPASK